MKRLLVLAFVLLFALLSICRPQPEPEETVPPAVLPVPSVPVSAEPEPLPEHSPLYLPEVPVEDVLRYFNEVCLDSEFVSSGDPSRLQKWMVPIGYQINGSYTDEDLAVLSSFTQWLSTLEGFPGIFEAETAAQANLQLHFCSYEEMLTLMGENFTGMDGAVTFWYENDAIYHAVVCCRSDLNQTLRNSVLLEEIYNGLGPIQDTLLRPDSVIYQHFSQPQSLSEVDELLLKLLYHPEMKCGMDAGECEAVIRRLYY